MNRTDSAPDGLGLLAIVILLSAVWFSNYDADRFYRRARQEGTKSVLSNAHEHAIAIDISECVNNPTKAEKDSAYYAKRIKRHIRHSGKDLLSLKKTDFYSIDTIHMQRPTEKNTIHTYVIPFPHETIYHDDTLWVYRYKSGSSSEYVLDTDKVSRDPRLSEYIKRYERAIAQLEKNRRKGNKVK